MPPRHHNPENSNRWEEHMRYLDSFRPLYSRAEQLIANGDKAAITEHGSFTPPPRVYEAAMYRQTLESDTAVEELAQRTTLFLRSPGDRDGVITIVRNNLRPHYDNSGQYWFSSDVTHFSRHGMLHTAESSEYLLYPHDGQDGFKSGHFGPFIFKSSVVDQTRQSIDIVNFTSIDLNPPKNLLRDTDLSGIHDPQTMRKWQFIAESISLEIDSITEFDFDFPTRRYEI